MITVATLLWAPNEKSYAFSHYDESDVEKLYRGFARHLTVPFRFVCFVDYRRDFCEPIEQHLIEGKPDYGSCIQPYRLNEPMILVGLDTIVVGNCDHLAAYAIGGQKLAVPRDPFFPQTVCNGVALVPQGCGRIWDAFDGGNDMEHIRALWRAGEVAVIDDIFPGQVCSYKGDIRQNGLTDDTRIVYFHGKEKPRELPHVGWIWREWHDNKPAERAA